MMLSTRLPYNTTSHSPTHLRNPSDDFIARLSPMNAVDTFRTPSGPLKACMDAATVAEQSFAIRAALASRNIYEWLDELRDWPWPTKGGVGFQTPASAQGESTARGRPGSGAEETSEVAIAPPQNPYLGSLLESHIARYEARIGQIQNELDKLNIEEIKGHVLKNHIMPLSRPDAPTSPSYDRHFGMPSLASYAKMDDLTAVITATVVQALPNLSRVLRLMNSWSTRLTLLRRVPSLTSSLADAETAVQSGHAALEQGFKPQGDQFSPSTTPGGSNFFEVMKLELEKKVTKAARILDYMLDTLEGRDDTLPEDWIDRMEVVERRYAHWIAAYERMLRDAELKKTQIEAAKAEKAAKRSKSTDNAVRKSDSSRQATGDNTRVNKTNGAQSDVVINVHPADENTTQAKVPEAKRSVSSTSQSTVIANDLGSPQSPGIPSSRIDFDLDAEYFQLEPGVDTRESVPRISVENSRPEDAVSETSTVIGSPTMSPDLHPVRGSRGSPHTPPKTTRSVSTSLGDMPPVFEDPEDEDASQRSLSSSAESNTKKLRSPFVLSDAGGEDDHFRKQISEVLEKIPAKVHLSSHLNPPDLQLPYSKPRPTAERSARSRSGTSSRASTPSFMLAPVSRPRQQRGNQDIKLYHLSRGTGEAPIKLYIRCVGERVMVRVGGGWADLGEYLKEYSVHHTRRSAQGGDSRVEVRDIPRSVSSMSTRTSVSPPGRPSPPSRPASAAEYTSPIYVKKTRKRSGGEDMLGPRLPRTPLAYGAGGSSEPPSSGSTGRSRSSSALSWNAEEDSSLGMAGPRGTRKALPAENLEWVESIKEKVRAASSSADMMKAAAAAEAARDRDHHHNNNNHNNNNNNNNRLGDYGKIGGTKRMFRKAT